MKTLVNPPSLLPFIFIITIGCLFRKKALFLPPKNSIYFRRSVFKNENRGELQSKAHALETWYLFVNPGYVRSRFIATLEAISHFRIKNWLPENHVMVALDKILKILHKWNYFLFFFLVYKLTCSSLLPVSYIYETGNKYRQDFMKKINRIIFA